MQKINIPKIKLSVWGCIRAVENSLNTGKTATDCLVHDLIDAGAISGYAFFGSLASTQIIGVPIGSALYAAFIAAGVSFFGIFVTKRKLLKEAA